MKILKQKKYSNIEIDNSEKDVLQLVFLEKIDPQIIMIERLNINSLIKILTEYNESNN